METPNEGPLTDLLWSDPEDVEAWAESPRGAGWLFGSVVTSRFNQINDLDMIARGHQLVMDGFKYWFKNSSLISIYSAPNHLNRLDTVGAFLKINENLERQH